MSEHSPARPAGKSADMTEWGARGTAAVSFAVSFAFDRVSHAFGDRSVLQDITFDVAPGELMCLLGQSGSGKTTLLRIAAGIERQTEGRVLINGQEIAGKKAFLPPEQRGVGLVFQDFALFPHLTVRRNVAFGLKRMAREESRETVERALDRVGLVSQAEQYPHMLSGGEQQRVALARAIAPRPGILLMDEPFSGLDTRLRDQVRAETLAVLRETRTTAIFVTHDPQEAMRVGDRIALLRNGRIVQIDTPGTLYGSPVDFEAARFFSEVNALDGHVEGRRISTPIGEFDALDNPPGARVVVCARPQAIRIGETDKGDVLGRIVGRQFLGETDLVEVAVAGLDKPLIARVRAGDCATERDVSVHLDLNHVLIFARKGS